jgi:hypothetical protein
MTDEITQRNAAMVAQYQRVMDGEPIGPGPLVVGIDKEFDAWLAARGIGESLRKYAARTPAPPPTRGPLLATALNRSGQRIGLTGPSG